MNTLKRVVSHGDMNNPSRSLSPNTIDGKVEEGIKAKMWEKAHVSTQELRNLLKHHEHVPIPAPRQIQRRTSLTPTLSPINEIMGGKIDTQNSTLEQTTSPATLLLLPAATEPHLAGLHQNNSLSQEHCKQHLQWQLGPQFNLHSTQTLHAEKQANLFILPPRRTSSLGAPTSSCYANLSTPTYIAIKPKHQLRATSNPTLLSLFSNKLPPLPQHLRPGNQYSPRPSPRTGLRKSFIASTANYKGKTREIIQTPAKIFAAQNIPHHTAKDQVKMSRIGKHFPPPPCPPPNYPPPLPPPQKRRKSSAEEALSSAAAT
ncbi:hypothetical protein F4801DRAFT_603241 [Xylaria longipes]|nr:hypothetical protein F4801DRAFT_603241 [Xylaria longipes]RYC64156.1 hypothetical protein CHU98_g2040 [Xylaria longipes]